MASVLSMRSALGGSNLLAAPKATRSVARAGGVKVFARMTKDRVKLDKDTKWRNTIDIYPVNTRSAPPLLASDTNARGEWGIRCSGEFVIFPSVPGVLAASTEEVEEEGLARHLRHRRHLQRSRGTHVHQGHSRRSCRRGSRPGGPVALCRRQNPPRIKRCGAPGGS